MTGSSAATYLGSKGAEFACPQEGFDEAFATALATEHLRALVGRFASRFRRVVSANSAGLLESLEGAMGAAGGFDAVWDSSFGALQDAVFSTRPREPIRSAVTMAAALGLQGHSSQWEARIERHARLRIGQWLLPLANNIEIRATPRGLTVRTCAGRRRAVIEFRRQRAAWVAAGCDSLPTAQVSGRRLVILSEAALHPHERCWAARSLSAMPPAAAVAAAESASLLLAKYAPLYGSWVGRVARDVVPWHHAPGMLNSGSAASSPGLIGMSTGHGAAETAQMLVHEATHQYMYLLRRLGPLDDGSDPTLYHSPVRGTKRPIDAIVVAYHAAGNEALLFRSCRRRGLKSSFFEEREPIVSSQLRIMEHTLQASRAITPLGHALWQPLYRRLHG